MGGLIELLGIEGGAESEGDTGAEENVVGESSDTTVVDLDLFISYIRNRSSMANGGSRELTLAKETGSSLYLLATSSPTAFPLFESHEALAPASTCELTLW